MKQKELSAKQKKSIIKSINNMFDSEEHYLFMIFKNGDGSDTITQYSFNANKEKITCYIKRFLGLPESPGGKR